MPYYLALSVLLMALKSVASDNDAPKLPIFLQGNGYEVTTLGKWTRLFLLKNGTTLMRTPSSLQLLPYGRPEKEINLVGKNSKHVFKITLDMTIWEVGDVLKNTGLWQFSPPHEQEKAQWTAFFSLRNGSFILHTPDCIDTGLLRTGEEIAIWEYGGVSYTFPNPKKFILKRTMTQKEFEDVLHQSGHY